MPQNINVTASELEKGDLVIVYAVSPLITWTDASNGNKPLSVLPKKNLKI